MLVYCRWRDSTPKGSMSPAPLPHRSSACPLSPAASAQNHAHCSAPTAQQGPDLSMKGNDYQWTDNSLFRKEAGILEEEERDHSEMVGPYRRERNSNRHGRN